MKQETEDNIKGIMMTILSLIIVLGVGILVLTESRDISKSCYYENQSIKEGLQPIKCSTLSWLYDENKIDGICHVNCTERLEITRVVS